MYPFPTLGHAQLVDLARQIADAARDHQPQQVGASTLRLFEALTDHVLAERPELLYAPPADAILLRRGQQHVAELLLDLAASAAGDTDHCSCSPIAEDVVAALTWQAEDERRHHLASVD